MNHKILFLTILSLAGITLFSTVGFSVPEKQSSSYPDLFNEIVGIIEENFYNPQQISQDFPLIKKTYQNQLEQISDMSEFSSLVNAMRNELNASHTYYLTKNDYEYYQLGDLFFKIPQINAHFHGEKVMYPSIGIITQSIEGKSFVASVLPGSIAEKSGLRKGDEIISVDKKPFYPVVSLRSDINNPKEFRIKRNKHSNPTTLTIKPEFVNPKEEMLAAQKSSIRMIKHNEKNIGYIHIYSYAGEEFQEELLNAIVWGELKKADALIIDLRYGLGGAWPYYLNIFNHNIPRMTMINRDGEENIVDSQWRKPAVYLVNQFSRSGKELLAFGAKKYGLATVIGEQTAGCTLGGQLFPISNGDFLFLAVQSGRIDGVNLEGIGVTPDIEVPFDIRYCNGNDPQLNTAIEYLFKKLTTKIQTEQVQIK